MYIATIPLGFPLNKLTDAITQIGWRANVKRDNVTIWEGDLRPISEPIVGMLWTVDVGANQIIWEAPNMPGQTLSVVSVVEQATGTVLFNFSNGNQRSVSDDWANAAEFADAIDATDDFLEKFLIAKAFRNSPDGSNKTTTVGAGVSANLLASVPIVYTPPE